MEAEKKQATPALPRHPGPKERETTEHKRTFAHHMKRRPGNHPYKITLWPKVPLQFISHQKRGWGRGKRSSTGERIFSHYIQQDRRRGPVNKRQNSTRRLRQKKSNKKHRERLEGRPDVRLKGEGHFSLGSREETGPAHLLIKLRPCD